MMILIGRGEDKLITLNSVLSIVAPYEMYIVMYTS